MNKIGEKSSKTLFIVLAIAAVLLFSGNLTGNVLFSQRSMQNLQAATNLPQQVSSLNTRVTNLENKFNSLQSRALSTQRREDVVENFLFGDSEEPEPFGELEIAGKCRCYCEDSLDGPQSGTKYKRGCATQYVCKKNSECAGNCAAWCQGQKNPATGLPYTMTGGGYTCDSNC